MKILILGGTVFLGYHLVDRAIKAGHEVTIFSRGRTNSSYYPQVEKLIGNRDGDLQSLKGRYWDAIIDTSGYVPRIVRDSVKLLEEATEHYTFISSISVYRDFLHPGVNENSPLGILDDPTIEDVGVAYGELKALCEQEVQSIMPDRSLIIRPGLIVGPHDPTDRFTYWPDRIRRGGSVLAPGNPDAIVQFIDVRDLAEWIIRMVEVRRTGVYNATGPDAAHTTTMQALLEECSRVTLSHAQLVWMNNDYLLQQGVGPWMELPLWIPGTGDTEKMAYMLAVDVNKAAAVGLTYRPISETIQDTIEWHLRRGNHELQAGMTMEREAILLDKWTTR